VRGARPSRSLPSASRRRLREALDAALRLPYFCRVANQAKNPAAPKDALPFEEALHKLESIVEAMESGDLPLETLLERYEEGSRLVKICQAKLEEAELKIQKLEKTAAGELVVKPVDLGAGGEPKTP
jgi:exodeoxyribonuclease VII small subunit